MDEIIQIFVCESEELLEDMEQALLALEASPNDDDLINRIFRAAHTIKGSAGLFGFDEIISFTHVVENLLDDIRNCLVPVSNELISLLMKCKDQISQMVADINSDEVVDYPEKEDLLQLLKAFSVSSGSSCEVPAQSIKASDENNIAKRSYHISIRLNIDTFRQGFDPEIMFDQLEDFINAYSNGASIVLGGDFNAKWEDNSSKEEYQVMWENFLATTGLRLACQDLITGSDDAISNCAYDFKADTDQILYRDSDAQYELSLESYEILDFEGVSDHEPNRAVFSWSKR